MFFADLGVAGNIDVFDAGFVFQVMICRNFNNIKRVLRSLPGARLGQSRSGWWPRAVGMTPFWPSSDRLNRRPSSAALGPSPFALRLNSTDGLLSFFRKQAQFAGVDQHTFLVRHHVGIGPSICL